MSSGKKTIVIVSESQLHRDPRVQVQIRALKDRYRLVCVGQSSPDVKDVAFRIVLPVTVFERIMNRVCKDFRKTFLRVGWFRAAYFCNYFVLCALRRVREIKPDLLLCNDVDMIGVGGRLKQQIGLTFYLDAHEYTPRQYDGNPKYRSMTRMWEAVLNRYAPTVDHMTTVCESIADEYAKNFNLKADAIVMNAPKFQAELKPSPVADGQIRMVHHGGANRSRRIEAIIDLLEMLDERFTLDFYLVDNNSVYLEELRERARGNERVRFNSPVPTAELSATLNQYDVGIYPLSPENYNHVLALPNKFFEFIQARLAIAIWPSVEMERLLKKYDLGVVTDEFKLEPLAAALVALDARQIRRFKQNSHQVAMELHAGKSEEKIVAGVERCLGAGLNKELNAEAEGSWCR